MAQQAGISKLCAKKSPYLNQWLRKNVVINTLL